MVGRGLDVWLGIGLGVGGVEKVFSEIFRPAEENGCGVELSTACCFGAQPVSKSAARLDTITNRPKEEAIPYYLSCAGAMSIKAGHAMINIWNEEPARYYYSLRFR